MPSGTRQEACRLSVLLCDVAPHSLAVQGNGSAMVSEPVSRKFLPSTSGAACLCSSASKIKNREDSGAGGCSFRPLHLCGWRLILAVTSGHEGDRWLLARAPARASPCDSAAPSGCLTFVRGGRGSQPSVSASRVDCVSVGRVDCVSLWMPHRDAPAAVHCSQAGYAPLPTIHLGGGAAGVRSCGACSVESSSCDPGLAGPQQERSGSFWPTSTVGLPYSAHNSTG